jgi:hypothetical protein
VEGAACCRVGLVTRWSVDFQRPLVMRVNREPRLSRRAPDRGEGVSKSSGELGVGGEIPLSCRGGQGRIIKRTLQLCAASPAPAYRAARLRSSDTTSTQAARAHLPAPRPQPTPHLQ